MDNKIQTNDTSNSDMVVDAVLELIFTKNPLLKIKMGEYRAKISKQYELYLISSLINELDEQKAKDFEDLMLSDPENRVSQNEFLLSNIPNSSQRIIDLSTDFIKMYGKTLQAI